MSENTKSATSEAAKPAPSSAAPQNPQQQNRSMTKRAAPDEPFAMMLQTRTAKAAIFDALPVDRRQYAENFIRGVITEVRMNPDLRNCDPKSIVRCAIEAAQLDLLPNRVTGHAYLVPYKRVCTLIPGYRGLQELAYRSGKVQVIYAEIVHEGDEYRVTKGLRPDIVHVPKTRERGEKVVPVGVYAVAALMGGARIFKALTMREVDLARARSKAGNSGPWVSDFEEMAKKTAVRRLFKSLPVSIAAQNAIERAIIREEGTPEQNDALDAQEAEDIGSMVFDVEPESVRSLPEGEHVDTATGEVTGQQPSTIEQHDQQPPERAALVKELTLLRMDHPEIAKRILGEPYDVAPKTESQLFDAIQGIKDAVKEQPQQQPKGGKGK